MHDLYGLLTAHRTASQFSHVAGICSSRGGDEYSEAQLPRRPTETTKGPPPPFNFPHCSTHTSTFPWCGGVSPTLHRCDPLRPVKASTHHSALWWARQKEQLRTYRKWQADSSTRAFDWTPWKMNRSLPVAPMPQLDWLMRRLFVSLQHFFFCRLLKVNSQKIDPSIALSLK